jgi:hypothetical protein
MPIVPEALPLVTETVTVMAELPAQVADQVILTQSIEVLPGAEMSKSSFLGIETPSHLLEGLAPGEDPFLNPEFASGVVDMDFITVVETPNPNVATTNVNVEPIVEHVTFIPAAVELKLDTMLNDPGFVNFLHHDSKASFFTQTNYAMMTSAQQRFLEQAVQSDYSDYLQLVNATKNQE